MIRNAPTFLPRKEEDASHPARRGKNAEAFLNLDCSRGKAERLSENGIFGILNRDIRHENPSPGLADEAGRSWGFDLFPADYSSSRNTRVFRQEIRAQSETCLHRGYNLVMKNKSLSCTMLHRSIVTHAQARLIADVRSGRRLRAAHVAAGTPRRS